VTEKTNVYATLASEAYRHPRYDSDVQKTAVEYGGRSFKMIDSAMDPFTGFSAVTFQDALTDDIVIAYRGTDDAIDGIVDAAMVGTRINIQAAESEIYTRQTISDRDKHYSGVATKPEITVTGHSLGGGLAQLNAEKFGLRGETFNPYGIVGLRGQDKEGGTQVINHVRATDIVSAASQHFGEVHVYATSADINALKSAGYGESSSPGIRSLVQNIELNAHFVSNFEDSKGNPSIVNEVTSKRYEENKPLVDSFRTDMLNQRTLLTLQLDHPELIGVRAMQGPARAMGTVMLAEGLFVVGETARGAQAIRDGAVSVVEATQNAARRVAETFSDPHMANALGSATYGMSPAVVPPNNADIRRHDHPGHELYTQAHKGVEQVDKQLGRTPDAATEKVAGALAVAAARDGLKRIDHVVLNDDGSKAFGVQGELNSPFKQIVQVDTAQAIKTPVEESSKQWVVAAEAHRQQAQVQVQQQAQEQTQAQAGPRPHGP
jgi:hypothetical protein